MKPESVVSFRCTNLRDSGVVLFDDIEASACLPISLFLKLTDRYPHQVPIKGGYITWKPKVIVFTSNYPWVEGIGARVEGLELRVHEAIHEARERRLFSLHEPARNTTRETAREREGPRASERVFFGVCVRWWCVRVLERESEKGRNRDSTRERDSEKERWCIVQVRCAHCRSVPARGAWHSVGTALAMCSGSETGLYLRLMDFCITQLQA